MAENRFSSKSNLRKNFLKAQNTHQPIHKVESPLKRDLAAMAKINRMLKEGFITWLGEIGRQY